MSRKDSNPHRRNQNPKCYHYTTGQLLFEHCKGSACFLIVQLFALFFNKKLHFFSSHFDYPLIIKRLQKRGIFPCQHLELYTILTIIVISLLMPKRPLLYTGLSRKNPIHCEQNPLVRHYNYKRANLNEYMISKDVIQFLYKKAKHPTKEFNKEFLDAVSEKCGKFHHVKFTDEYMIIDDLDTQNPFRNIRLSCIRRIEEIGEYVAVVLNSCIILFNNHTGKISINLRNSIGNKSCTTNPFKRLFLLFQKS